MKLIEEIFTDGLELRLRLRLKPKKNINYSNWHSYQKIYKREYDIMKNTQATHTSLFLPLGKSPKDNKASKGFYIPVRIASTGSRREAEIAGITPESKPINVAKAKPKKILKNESTKVKSSTAALAPSDTNHTKIIPTTPPRTERITASNKN